VVQTLAHGAGDVKCGNEQQRMERRHGARSNCRCRIRTMTKNKATGFVCVGRWQQHGDCDRVQHESSNEESYAWVRGRGTPHRVWTRNNDHTQTARLDVPDAGRVNGAGDGSMSSNDGVMSLVRAEGNSHARTAIDDRER
jgi:hypothetical protein